MPRSRAVDDAYWRAQATINAQVSVASLRAWRQVRPRGFLNSAGAWLSATAGSVRLGRRRSRQLAAAHYRVQRALDTGRTVPPLDGGASRAESVVDLMDDFQVLVTQIESGADSTEFFAVDALPDRVSHDRSQVDVDDFEWPDFDEPAADELSRAALAGAGLLAPARDLDRAVQRGLGRLDDPDFLAELARDVERAGAEAAAIAGREALAGGRGLLVEASEADQAVLGWARITDGSPCAFCAMLASRGAVYRNKNSATLAGSYRGMDDIDRSFLNKYHPRCCCQTVPVYRKEDFITPESRAFRDAWYESTKGLSGREAENAFRRYLEGGRRLRDAG